VTVASELQVAAELRADPLAPSHRQRVRRCSRMFGVRRSARCTFIDGHPRTPPNRNPLLHALLHDSRTFRRMETRRRRYALPTASSMVGDSERPLERAKGG
jgi:hypothetical protein